MSITACARSCSNQESSNAPASAGLDPQAVLVEKGRSVYMTNCIACHNKDPKLEGSPGPAVFGSSLELLEARILHTGYPSGYTPKKATQLMVKMPYLEKDIPALRAFLNSQP